MAGSFKDAMRKSGLASEAPTPAPTPKAKPGATSFREELSDDESLPPRFDAPALTVARVESSTPKPK